MSTDPETDGRLAGATRLTDALDDRRVLEAACSSIEAGVRETARLGAAEEIPLPGPLRVLAGIGLAFRRSQAPAEEPPLVEPQGLFRWGAITVLRRIGEGRF